MRSKFVCRHHNVIITSQTGPVPLYLYDDNCLPTSLYDYDFAIINVVEYTYNRFNIFCK